uniref:Methyl-accepting chemotaxis protein n=1 Tax=Desulfovibrio sp. U5L TaxID=596152 RepID=I2Q002_9BACT
MRLKSIQLKIALASGACLLACATILVVYGIISARNTQHLVANRVSILLEDQAKSKLGALAHVQAATIQGILQENLSTSRTLGTVFAVLRDNLKSVSNKEGITNPVRDILNDILLRVLQNNPTFLGTYTAWEANSLDDRDREFAGDTKNGYDITGRFLPYWNRDAQGQIARQALVNIETTEINASGVSTGTPYSGSREGREIVLDPFPYVVQGKEEWLTTMSAPINSNGKWYGMAGSDRRLDFMQSLAKDVNKSLYDGQGSVRIISNLGLIAASSAEVKELGQPARTVFTDDAAEVVRHVQQGATFVDVNQKTGMVRAYAPIQLGRTGKPWSVLLTVPTKVVMAEAQALEAELTARSRDSTIWQVGVGLGVSVLALAALWIVSSSIVRPIRLAADFADKVAAGDFSQTLAIDQPDETGILAHALRTMVGNLKTMIGQAEAKSHEAAAEADRAKAAVAEAEAAKAMAETAKAEGMLHAAQQLESIVEIITSASEQLSAQIEQSSHGADEQSHRMGDTAISMEEMNATVLEVAKNASNAAQTADQAKIKAVQGSIVVSQVVQGIEQIQHQSQKVKNDMNSLGKETEGIGKILNVISDIADQTNLLALNAAIEAARAGDAGRGFAVVADEVRKLAEKTMTATKEVGQAIRGIQDGTKKNIDNVERTGKNIEELTKFANDSGESLREIVNLSETTTDQVRAIATASEEQSSASEEINRNIEGVNRISMETADAMRQSAQAVTELANQAQVLKRIIDEMKSGDRTGAR